MKKIKKLKAALVYSGGDSSSADDQDTLIQLTEICQVLKDLDFETFHLSCNESVTSLEKSLMLLKPDFIFNLVETLKGSDSLIYLAAALYEMLKIPYTGCNAISLATLSSKIRQKKLLKLAGLPTADFFVMNDEETLAEKSSRIKSWIVKSDSEHASVGINSDSVVATAAEALKKIADKTLEFSGVWFAEEFIDGREFNISIIEDINGKPQILPVAEIVFENFPKGLPKIVDYAAKWDSDSEVYAATKRSFEFSADDHTLITKLEKICSQCWFLFQLNGAVRVDFRVDEKGEPWVLEVNANPCLSSDAGFMAAAARAGLTPSQVIKKLIPVQINPANLL